MSSPISMLAVFGLGPTELVVILVILLVLFGGSKLPSLAKGLGQSIKEFKKASNEVESAIEDEVRPAEPRKAESEKSADTR